MSYRCPLTPWRDSEGFDLLNSLQLSVASAGTFTGMQTAQGYRSHLAQIESPGTAW